MRDLAQTAGESAARAVAGTHERRARGAARDAEASAQQSLLHDLRSPPGLAFDAAWRTPNVVDCAGVIYENRDFDRLPVLAVALEEAGCDRADLLDHLRGLGPHVKGCWTIDLVLGKE
jgi:hypothetical protein